MRIPRVQARLASACLAGMAAVHVAYVWWAWELSQRVDSLGHDPGAVAGIMDHAHLLTTLDRMHLAGLAVTALAFLAWFYQVRRNVTFMRPAAPAPLGPGLATGSWLMPVVNCVLPYVLIVDVWKESQQKTAYVPGAPGTGFAVHAWGVGWVAMWVAFASLRSARGIDSVETMDVTASGVAALSTVCAVTAIFAVLMVRAVTERQAARVNAPAARVLVGAGARS